MKRVPKTAPTDVESQLSIPGTEPPVDAGCRKCPRAAAIKCPPTIPPAPKIAVVGMAPGDKEEQQQRPFVGPTGAEVRGALTAAGLDPVADVAYLNLARCRPEDDDFSTTAWRKAEAQCIKNYLQVDLARMPDIPLVVLGARPLHWATDGSSRRRPRPGAIDVARGLWRLAQGRDVFVARHPASFLRREVPVAKKAAQTQQFRTDIRSMVDRILGRRPPTPLTIQTYRSPREAASFLIWMAEHPGPWVFDIETFDGAAFPSRPFVSTDPFHPDFRLRGVAFAWADTEGAWVDCRDVEGAELFALVFASPADKGAWHGNFDQEGVEQVLQCPVIGRTFDGMLAEVALSDGRHESLGLEKAVVDILKASQYWAIDKAQMRDLDLDTVATGAVGDACATYRLCAILHDRLARGEYLAFTAR